MSDCWENIIVGMKVEVENRDSEVTGVFSNAYWVATVLRISGYAALLRYEGFGQDPSQDFWMSLCSDKVHPVGWCATKGKPLIPPKSKKKSCRLKTKFHYTSISQFVLFAAIQAKYQDWKDFLVKRLTGARTLPSNFYLKVWESVDSIFRPGMKLEVVDKMRICQVRVATIQEIVGRRLYLQYDEVDHDDRGFWCHEESPLIHPVGWARRVGHQIVASHEYFERCAMDNLRQTDCTPDMFPEYKLPPNGSTFAVGMKIEAVDPLNLATICVATVMKVLRFGYIMVRIDGYENDATGSDWFCYHQSSPLIFPPGFSERNNLELKPPTGHEDRFSWYDYLKATRSQAAPVSLFLNRDDVKHGFKVGMKIEATDQMDPRLVCVSTISRVVGRLLKVHFDGWEDDYDQWMDCENVDIYPVGWAELVGHKLEGPRMSTPAKKEKRKPVGRKSKKRTTTSSNGTPVVGTPTGGSTTPVTNGRKARKVSSPDSGGAPTKSESMSPSPPPEEEKNPIQPLKISISSPNSTNSPPQPSTAAAAVDTPDETPGELVADASENQSPPKDMKIIPRLVDSAGQAASQRGRDNNLDPSSWTVEEVSTFLEINECATLAEAFSEQVG